MNKQATRFAAPEWRTYRPVQAVPFPDRVQTHVDRLIYVGMAPRRPATPWKHVAWFLVLILIMVVAIMGTGGRVEVFR